MVVLIENWKPIVRVVGYEVSDLGNIRRSARGINTFPGRRKKPTQRKDGYLIVGCYSLGKRTNVFVHRAVVEAFIREMIDDEEANHEDGHKWNCRLDNLTIMTPAQNMAHAAKHGLTASGERWHTQKQMDKIARLSGDGHWSRHKPDRLARGDSNGSRTKPDRLERGEARHCAKLKEDDIRVIRDRAANGYDFAVIAAVFGVTKQNIRYIVTRQSWKHVA